MALSEHLAAEAAEVLPVLEIAAAANPLAGAAAKLFITRADWLTATFVAFKRRHRDRDANLALDWKAFALLIRDSFALEESRIYPLAEAVAEMPVGGRQRM